MTRLDWLRRWWSSARSTVVEATWEARFWAVVGVVGACYPPLAKWVPGIYFMSAWANAKAARIQRGDAVREMMEEQAEEVQ